MPTITVTTANICGNPIRAKRVVRKRMRRALRRPGVTFGQEAARSNRFRVGRGNYSHAWHSIANLYGKVTEGGPHEVPVSLPGEYVVLHAETRELHEGRRRVSPARYATIVRTTHGVAGRPVAFVNCHTVSKPRRGVTASEWRISRYATYLEQLGAIVAELHTDGYTVVFGGDMNKREVPNVHPDQHVLVSSGLDHLWIVPAKGATWAHLTRHKVPRTVLMDHPILSATFMLS